MSLSAAFNIIGSSFAANAAQTALASSNIANANTTGYSRKIANLATTAYGGVDVASVTSAANQALQAQADAASSEAAAQQAVSEGLTTLAETVSDSASSTSASGAAQNGASPAAMLANLQSALTACQASPGSTALGAAAVTAASSLAASLNSGSQTVDQVREQADSKIASDVSTMNSLLSQFDVANGAVVSGLQAGQDVTTAQDSRNSLLTQMSKLIGLTTVVASNGSMSIYTDSGVTLYQNGPAAIAFTPTASFAAGSTGGAVTVGGVPITGAAAPMAIHSGEIAGLVSLRDTIATTYQAQLDQIAAGLINAFAESDQSASPTKPPLPGLFTFPGATGVPSANAATGLAAAIMINPNVDPTHGGDVTRLRDGGISAPGDAAYVYNTTGGAAYSARLQQLIGNLGSATTFDSSAGLEGSGSLTAYVEDSVSWLQARNQTASSEADYQKTVANQAQSALTNASGVNMDAEMTNMLTLENSYATTAKLLTTANAMFSALLMALP